MKLSYGFLYDKRKTILIIIAILVVVTVAFEFIKNKTPKPVINIAEVDVFDYVNTSLDNTSKDFNVISISPAFTIEGEIPETANVYNYQLNKITDELLNQLVSTLGLTYTETDVSGSGDETFRAYAEYKELTVYKDDGIIIYTNPPYDIETDTLVTSALDPTVPISAYSNTTDQILRDLGFDLSQYKLENYSYIKYPAYEYAVVNTPEEAGAVELVYRAETDGYPLIDQTGNLNPNVIRVWLTGDMEIRRINASILGSKSESTSQVLIKDEKQLKSDITAENVKFISSSLPPFDEISNVVVQSARLSYYSIQDRIIPIFVLTANVTSSQNETGIGYLYLEAIRR